MRPSFGRAVRLRPTSAIVIVGGLALALVLAGGQAPAAAEPVVSEPSDYRLDNYRAPVPATLAGARVVDTAGAKALFDAGRAVFIDVLPVPPKPKLPPGTIYRQKPRFDIPGSVWLPDVGYGRLNASMDGWFRDSLARLTAGDRARDIVIYCLADCWMSWNAARRAVAWGYTSVIWYPEGTDGWAFEDLPLERRDPEPRPEETGG
ncbi:hypothetical protein A6302_03158 [Methylobrevis pamukkalensis]|uniref:Rhodanese domain-containing protein n=2 Tax=Methylobrevis pamukkalensis TaxID=1439726 RepID=A0A1E3H1U2_9HYPH|nr:hypothetical protein A6302_03158 [Methylobrevis pamukkalensis]